MHTRGWVIGVAAVLVLTGCASKERMIPVGSTVVADTTGGKGPDVYSYCDDKGNMLYMTKDKSGPVAVIQGGCKKLPDVPVAAAIAASPPLGRHFLDQSVAQCVIATPVSPTAVALTPCPPGAPSSLPASTPPAVAEPKVTEPVVIRIEVVPVPPDTPTPKAAPKAAPKKVCPCP